MVVETATRKKLDFEAIDEIVHEHNVEPGAVIPILQDIQDTYGYVPPAAIQRIADNMNVSASEIYGIVTFYSQFRTEPQGKYLIKVCHGTACHLCGADMVAETLAQAVGAKEGATSEDGMFTVERVACLGCCSLAPVMMVNGEAYGRLTPDTIGKIITEFRKKEASVPA